MPWKEVSAMSLREEFVLLACAEDANVQRLCERFSISRKTAYKWLHRYRQEGTEGLQDRSRRPLYSPSRTSWELEELVLQARAKHPVWGGRKLRWSLCRQYPHLAAQLPHPNTITDILRRHNVLSGPHTPPHQAHHWHRFEHPVPNELWQMDFKGYFPTVCGARCNPLTILDDHSRFSLGLRACPNQQEQTVKSQLSQVMRVYGMPSRITMDNGAPWGDTQGSPFTGLTVWLLHLGIKISHSRPYHPQTQGKDERFHRTMGEELLYRRTFESLEHCQQEFDRWRDEYNLHRPHQALGMQVPSSRYQPSACRFPEALPPIEYPAVGTGGVVAVRKVQGKGEFDYKGKQWRVVSKAFKGYPVALKLTQTEGVLDIYFCQHPIAQIDLRLSTQSNLPEQPV